MKQKGYRTETYTRRHWHCWACSRNGLVLIHKDDEPERAAQRRRESHNAQVRHDRCVGKLRWWTESQELETLERTTDAVVSR